MQVYVHAFLGCVALTKGMHSKTASARLCWQYLMGCAASLIPVFSCLMALLLFPVSSREAVTSTRLGTDELESRKLLCQVLCLHGLIQQCKVHAKAHKTDSLYVCHGTEAQDN